jgi:hypothetical protein
MRKDKVKVKLTLEQAMEAEGGRSYNSTLSLTSALVGVGGQRHVPATLFPRKTRYSLYGRLGGPQGRLYGCGKTRLQTGFDLRNVQPGASRDTDWALPAHPVQWIPRLSRG